MPCLTSIACYSKTQNNLLQSISLKIQDTCNMIVDTVLGILDTVISLVFYFFGYSLSVSGSSFVIFGYRRSVRHADARTRAAPPPPPSRLRRGARPGTGHEHDLTRPRPRAKTTHRSPHAPRHSHTTRYHGTVRNSPSALTRQSTELHFCERDPGDSTGAQGPGVHAGTRRARGQLRSRKTT
jgi:hypothetical protein